MNSRKNNALAQWVLSTFLLLFLVSPMLWAEDQSEVTKTANVTDFFVLPPGRTLCSLYSYQDSDSSSFCRYTEEQLVEGAYPLGIYFHAVRFSLDKVAGVDLHYYGSSLSGAYRYYYSVLMKNWILRNRDTNTILSISTGPDDWAFNRNCRREGDCSYGQSLYFSLEPGEYEFVSSLDSGIDGRDASSMDGIVLNLHSCDVTSDLPNNQWRQISLPCNPGTRNKVSDIFSNLSGTYNTDWVMYRYNTASNAYTKLGRGSVLKQGVGYWILQKSAHPVSLKMPEGSTPNATVILDVFDILLSTKSGAKQWNMIGYPYDTAGMLNNIRVSTHSGDCAPSCNLSSTENEGIVHKQFWNYEHNAYTQVNVDDKLNPWAAYWVVTLSNAAVVSPIKLMVTKQWP
jgi:hypothetical protein